MPHCTLHDHISAPVHRLTLSFTSACLLILAIPSKRPKTDLKASIISIINVSCTSQTHSVIHLSLIIIDELTIL